MCVWSARMKKKHLQTKLNSMIYLLWEFVFQSICYYQLLSYWCIIVIIIGEHRETQYPNVEHSTWNGNCAQALTTKNHSCESESKREKNHSIQLTKLYHKPSETLPNQLSNGKYCESKVRSALTKFIWLENSTSPFDWKPFFNFTMVNRTHTHTFRMVLQLHIFHSSFCTTQIQNIFRISLIKICPNTTQVDATNEIANDAAVK